MLYLDAQATAVPVFLSHKQELIVNDSLLYPCACISYYKLATLLRVA